MRFKTCSLRSEIGEVRFIRGLRSKIWNTIWEVRLEKWDWRSAIWNRSWRSEIGEVLLEKCDLSTVWEVSFEKWDFNHHLRSEIGEVRLEKCDLFAIWELPFSPRFKSAFREVRMEKHNLRSKIWTTIGEVRLEKWKWRSEISTTI